MKATANGEPNMSSYTNQYIREVLNPPEAPPSIAICYFYTSPLAIDDPLSPLPPLSTGTSTGKRQPSRPFSDYDNAAIQKSWLRLRKEILKHNEELGEKQSNGRGTPTNPTFTRLKRKRGGSTSSEQAHTHGRDIPGATRSTSSGPHSRSTDLVDWRQSTSGSRDHSPHVSTSLKALDSIQASPIEPKTTGTPFIRAPSRENFTKAVKSTQTEALRRPGVQEQDSYRWDDDMERALSLQKDKGPVKNAPEPKAGPSALVPVGVSRLHHVVMDAESIRMESIYWSPLNDVAQIVRGTWFYKDTMMPVEIEVANMLEAGYLELRPWTQTWKDELNSAIEVGAFGEMKILHKLWSERVKKSNSRPSSSAQMQSGGMISRTSLGDVVDPAQERREIVEDACDLIDISTGFDGQDHKAGGDMEYGPDGRKRLYPKGGIIYATENEAYILKPALQPSDYYGRRPLANYIRKGRSIGVGVTRGFDRHVWDKLHPRKDIPKVRAARAGVSSPQAGSQPSQRQKHDPELAQSERPKVSDLVLVIHGIGQKLSERMETFHFTHAMNDFRREMNVELGTSDVKRHLRKDMGGVMILPVNWRHRVSLEVNTDEIGANDDPAVNKYTLKDITPDTLSSVRGIVSDVMLDIPYYLSPMHNPKMIFACIQEANRIYRLWCANNPGFAQYGRVHLIAHSLGSVMAIDILSQQPTSVDPRYIDPSCAENALPGDQFIFNTTNLFVCGSPVGLFLLMKNANLLPRRDKEKPGADSYAAPGVVGEQGTYGCLAVDNIYNIINPYDPVACRINPTVDVVYATILKPAIIPSATSSYFSFPTPFWRSADQSDNHNDKPATNRLPANVELETHNFTREEIAEKRAYLLNDNGQIDYFMKYGGGPLEIQYLTMLGAHSSYWLSRDFVRMVAVEVGRAVGKEGTVLAMRAQKKKMVVSNGDN